MSEREGLQSVAAYESLRASIVGGQLGPETMVTERAMMQATGLGKTPVREALARLAAEGLVTPVPRRGYRVTSLSGSDVAELLELWRVVGPATARLAAQRAPERLLAALHESAQPLQTDLEVGRRFFATLADCTGNTRLVEANRRLFNELYRYVIRAYRERGPKEWIASDFAAMRAALEVGDVDGLVAAYVASIEHGAAELGELFGLPPSAL